MNAADLHGGTAGGSNPTSARARRVFLAGFTTSRDPELRAYAATHPDTPRRALNTLSNDGNWQVRAAAARNPRLRPRRLRRLARDEHRVRVAVAENPNTDRRTLTRLAFDPNALAREAAARNPQLLSRLCTVLAWDHVDTVAAAAAENPNTDDRVTAGLIVAAARAGNDTAWRAAAAHWPAATADTIRLLCDTHPEATDAEIISLAEATTGEPGPNHWRRS